MNEDEIVIELKSAGAPQTQIAVEKTAKSLRELASASREAEKAAKDNRAASLAVAKALDFASATDAKNKMRALAQAHREAAQSAEKLKDQLKGIGGNLAELSGLKTIAQDMSNMGAMVRGLTVKLMDMKTGLVAVGGGTMIAGAGLTAMGSAALLAQGAVTGLGVAIAGYGTIRLAAEEYKNLGKQIDAVKGAIESATLQTDRYSKMTLPELQAELARLEAEASKTFTGMLKLIGKFIDQSSQKIATPMFEPLKAELSNLITLLNSPQVTAWVDKFRAKVQTFSEKDFPAIIAKLKEFFNLINANLPTIQAFMDRLAKVGSAGLAPLGTLLDVFGEALLKAGNALATNQAVFEGASDVAQTFGSVLAIVGTAVGGLLKGIGEGLAPTILDLSSRFNETVGTGEGFKNFLQTVSGIAASLGKVIGETLGAVGNFAFTLLEVANSAGFFTDKMNLIEIIFTTVKDIFDRLTQAINDNRPAIEQFISLIGDILTQAFSFLGEAAKFFVDLIADNLPTILATVNPLLSSLGDILGIVGEALSALSPILSPLFDLLVNVVNIALWPLKEALNALVTAITFVQKEFLAAAENMAKFMSWATQFLPHLSDEQKKLAKSTWDMAAANLGAQKSAKELALAFNDISREIQTGRFGEATKDALAKIDAAFKSKNPELIAEASKLAQKMEQEYKLYIDKLDPTTRKAFEDAFAGIRAKEKDAKAAGSIIGNGMADSVMKPLLELAQRAGDAVKAAIAAAQQQAAANAPKPGAPPKPGNKPAGAVKPSSLGRSSGGVGLNSVGKPSFGTSSSGSGGVGVGFGTARTGVATAALQTNMATMSNAIKENTKAILEKQRQSRDMSKGESGGSFKYNPQTGEGSASDPGMVPDELKKYIQGGGSGTANPSSGKSGMGDSKPDIGGGTSKSGGSLGSEETSGSANGASKKVPEDWASAVKQIREHLTKNPNANIGVPPTADRKYLNYLLQELGADFPAFAEKLRRQMGMGNYKDDPRFIIGAPKKRFADGGIVPGRGDNSKQTGKSGELGGSIGIPPGATRPPSSHDPVEQNSKGAWWLNLPTVPAGGKGGGMTTNNNNYDQRTVNNNLNMSTMRSSENGMIDYWQMALMAK